MPFFVQCLPSDVVPREAVNFDIFLWRLEMLYYTDILP